MTPARLHKPSHVTIHEGGSDRADWRKRAACLDEDPELFFPVGNTEPALIQTAVAKAVCRTCPVIADCLTWALDTREDFGVWGGLSENERRALKRREYRARAKRDRPMKHGTPGGAQAHYRRGEKACPECLRGDARAHRRRKAEQRAREATP